jgi:hypothetical protein
VERSVEVLLDILKTHSVQNAAIASTCSRAIKNLVHDNRIRRRFAAVPGSLESLVDVLNAHGRSNSDVAKACLWAIYSLANYDAGIRYRFGSTEVFSAIVSMIKHGKSTDFAASAILGLCQDTPANVAKFNALNACDALEVEARAHPTRDKRLALKALRGSKL